MFGRRKQQAGNPRKAIAEFWIWWRDAQQPIADAIGRGNVSDLAGDISQRVHAIDPDLEWELTPGHKSKHGFVLTPAGSAKLRATVARWLAEAPAPTETWQFYGSRQPDASVLTATLQINGHEVDLARLRFGARIDEDHAFVEVRVHHPVFGKLDDETRWRVSFMSLDWVLGEERVAAWVGPVEPAIAEPPGAVEGLALAALVDTLVDKHREPIWVLLQGQRKNTPITATAQRPLRPVRWPRFDTHVEVQLRYADRGNGFPTDASLEQLRAIEDELTQLLGRDGDLLAHETGGGVRSLHFYVDGSAAVAAPLRARAGELGAKSTESYDPDLEHVRHLS